MNSPFAIEQATYLANRPEVQQATTDEQRIAALFRCELGRDPSDDETASALAYLHSATQPESVRTAGDDDVWRYGYGPFDASTQRLATFIPLPHFTGSALQGGPESARSGSGLGHPECRRRPSGKRPGSRCCAPLARLDRRQRDGRRRVGARHGQRRRRARPGGLQPRRRRRRVDRARRRGSAERPTSRWRCRPVIRWIWWPIAWPSPVSTDSAGPSPCDSIRLAPAAAANGIPPPISAVRNRSRSPLGCGWPKCC